MSGNVLKLPWSVETKARAPGLRFAIVDCDGYLILEAMGGMRGPEKLEAIAAGTVERMNASEPDHARLVAGALCLGVASWQPAPGSLRVGDLMCGGHALRTALDEGGVPAVDAETAAALRRAVASQREVMRMCRTGVESQRFVASGHSTLVRRDNARTWGWTCECGNAGGFNLPSKAVAQEAADTHSQAMATR